jgi:hypothetical protein
MTKIANYEIENHISKLADFVNYNSSIIATTQNLADEQIYTIVHWNTLILRYSITTDTIYQLDTTYHSQTTSTLVGRIVRSLPNSAVMRHFFSLDSKSTKRKLARMLRLP